MSIMEKVCAENIKEKETEVYEYSNQLKKLKEIHQNEREKGDLLK